MTASRRTGNGFAVASEIRSLARPLTGPADVAPLVDRVGGSLHDGQAVGAAQLGLSSAVQFEHRLVPASHDQQGGCLHLREPSPGQVGTAPPGHHR